MSQKSRILFGVAAIALTLGAIPLAAGRDLAGDVFNRSGVISRVSSQISSQVSLGTPATGINRAAKADRAGSVVRSAVATRTISLQFNGLDATSVVVRVPVAQASRPGAFAPSWTRSDKRAVACEPVVSVLTEVAKLLEPGRCVT